MTKAILITQCLQNDFACLLEKHDALPNALHIGYSEALRLLGERVEHGPVNSVMDWAYNSSEKDLTLIHIRDWHDPKDLLQKTHLESFGLHCLKDTKGANFIFEKIRKKNRAENIVNASGLNDFVNTNLEKILKPFQHTRIPVGIMGVWTEAKISFLSYELRTRYPMLDIAICPALCASSSRTSHFLALENLQNILGIQIIPSVGSFISFLSSNTKQLKTNHSLIEKRLSPRLENKNFHFNKKLNISEEDNKLLLYLFRDCISVEFKQLDGGFSGNVVLSAIAKDILGHTQVPAVIKIGPRDEIAIERTSFEHIEETLGNNAPAIVDFAELENRGAIKYRYAEMSHSTREKTITFQKFYTENETPSISKILDIVFQMQLGRLYDAATFEKLNLLKYYEFQSKYASGIQKSINKLSLQIIDDEWIHFPHNQKMYNPVNFYRTELPKFLEKQNTESFCSYVHGDLNGKNIMIDAQKNAWLIDFFHTHRGHVLKDMLKLENDILYIFCKLDNENELEEAFKLSNILLNISDLGSPIKPEVCNTFENKNIRKACETICRLRSYYPKRISWDRDPYQLHIALLRYAMHTLSFEESSSLQKIWALYSGSICARKILIHNQNSHRLYVDFLKNIDNKNIENAKLIGLTILPGRLDKERILDDDIIEIKNNKIDSVVCLLSIDELSYYGVGYLLSEYRNKGLNVYQLAIKDQGIPSVEQVHDAVDFIHEKIQNKKRVLIHCVGGLGRSGTIAAAYYILKAKLDAADAIALVREARSPRAVESKAQVDFLYSLK